MLLLWRTRWHCSAVSHLMTQHETWLGIVWFDLKPYHHVHLAVFLFDVLLLILSVPWFCGLCHTLATNYRPTSSEQKYLRSQLACLKIAFEVACDMLILSCQTKANTRGKISLGSAAINSRKFLILCNVNCVCWSWRL